MGLGWFRQGGESGKGLVLLGARGGRLIVLVESVPIGNYLGEGLMGCEVGG